MIKVLNKLFRRKNKDFKILNNDNVNDDKWISINKEDIHFYASNNCNYSLINFKINTNFLSMEICNLFSDVQISHNIEKDIFVYDIIENPSKLKKKIEELIYTPPSYLSSVYEFAKNLSQIDLFVDRTAHLHVGWNNDVDDIRLSSEYKIVNGLNAEVIVLRNVEYAVISKDLFDTVMCNTYGKAADNVYEYFCEDYDGNYNMYVILSFKCLKDSLSDEKFELLSAEDEKIYSIDELMEKFPGQWE